MCVCIVGVVLGRGCVVLTDATIVCHSCVCIVGVVLDGSVLPLFATWVLWVGCVVLTDATIVCHSCVCVCGIVGVVCHLGGWDA